MTPNRREFEKQCAFQKFCKSVLHNEACNAHEEIRRRRVREVTFSDLALYEERQPNCPFVLYVGTRKLVKRKEFEEYIRRELII